MFDLMSELQKHFSYDKNEEKCVKDTLQFLKASSNCFDRSNLSGHITAGGLVCDKKGNVLLNHHKKTGLWLQFGGHCDGDSDCFNVAKREIFEESGISDLNLGKDGIFDVAIMKIPHIKNEPAHLHYDINFLFFVNESDFKVSNESIEIKWVTIEEARNLIHPEDKGMFRMLAKYKEIIKTL